MPLRELVVIRTHDSLITPPQSSRNIAQGADTAGGRTQIGSWTQIRSCKQVDVHVWRKRQQACAQHESLDFTV